MSTFDIRGRPMTLVYLDQCALSSLLDQPRNASWVDVRETLLEGNRRRRLLCPYSLEHIVETAAMPRDAVEVDALLRRLSLGQSFRLEYRLVAAQINSILRDDTLPSPQDVLEPNRFRPLSDSSFRELALRQKRDLDAYNVSKMELQNMMNAAFRDGRGPTPEIRRVILRLQHESYIKRFSSELEGVRRTGRVAPLASPDRWPSAIISTLVREYGFGMDDLGQLKSRVDAEGLLFVPFFKVKIILEAAAKYKQQNIQPADQYDITRVACALPFVDILVTDGGVAAELREAGLDADFATEVFSTRNAERAALLRRLRSALDDTSVT